MKKIILPFVAATFLVGAVSAWSYEGGAKKEASSTKVASEKKAAAVVVPEPETETAPAQDTAKPAQKGSGEAVEKKVDKKKTH